MRKLLTRLSLAPFAAPATLLMFVLAYAMIGLLTLDPASRAVPLLAATVTGILIVLELYRACRASDAGRGRPTRVTSEYVVIASVIGAVIGIYVVGFLIALPIYLILSITLVGRRSVRVAVLTAVLTTAAIYVAFELILSYRLFPGIALS